MEFKEIENKWQEIWNKNSELYKARDIDKDKKVGKKYVLVEFPYPSGSGLHIGHAFSFTGGDVYARFKRMQGYNVMFPMGWDAFGLPTENYAIKMKRKPQEVTRENTDMFRSQMKKLAFSFDWSREVNTTDPNYYKWTQWIFIKLFEKGLAQKQEMPINWCPKDKIGLANEEVINGKCERCGTDVERRTISQWVVKITDYANRLIEGLKNTDFIDKVKQAQINWIGKKEGMKIKFEVKNSDIPLEVFTTRPDTLLGVTFMVVAPEHFFVGQARLNQPNRVGEIKEYVDLVSKKSEIDRTDMSKVKTGVFSGLYAVNPITKKEIPIWISDYVTMSYGTGAIMAVPSHDERDAEFARKFDLPIDNEFKPDEGMWNLIVDKSLGDKTVTYHLRDWIFSRQHYWGEPIPMIYCEKDGWVTVPESELPIKLPEVEAYEPTDDGKSPLSKIDSFVNCICLKCGGAAKRETDTMPNWAGSDWYFLRYIDPANDIEIASQELMKKWMPVDVYIGGDEHNTLHLLYSRFIYQFLWDLGVVPHEYPEPYIKRTSHGVILGPDNQRMSKTKGNVIVPESVADKYGVDVTRMYLMFMGPFDGTMAWNENTLMGVKRFLEKFERFIDKQTANNSASNIDVFVIINKLIASVTRDIEEFGYNTAIAKMMEALNKLSIKNYELGIEETKVLVKLLAPLAPYTAEELWNKIGGEGSVHIAEWPVADPKYLVDDMVTIVVAINGKVRDQIKIESLKSKIENKDEIIEMAKRQEKMVKWLEGKEIKKEIYIPGKMVNLVVI